MAADAVAIPCPKCGATPAADGCAPYGMILYCPDCYYGAEDAGPQFTGSGETLALAVAHWNERVEEESRCEECGASVLTTKVKIGASMFDICEDCAAKLDVDDRRENDSDPLACPGCGGMCQVACR